MRMSWNMNFTELFDIGNLSSAVRISSFHSPLWKIMTHLNKRTGGSPTAAYETLNHMLPSGKMSKLWLSFLAGPTVKTIINKSNRWWHSILTSRVSMPELSKQSSCIEMSDFMFSVILSISEISFYLILAPRPSFWSHRWQQLLVRDPHCD